MAISVVTKLIYFASFVAIIDAQFFGGYGGYGIMGYGMGFGMGYGLGFGGLGYGLGGYGLYGMGGLGMCCGYGGFYGKRSINPKDYPTVTEESDESKKDN